MCSYLGTDGARRISNRPQLAKFSRKSAVTLQMNPGILVDGAFNHRPVHRVVVQGGDLDKSMVRKSQRQRWGQGTAPI